VASTDSISAVLQELEAVLREEHRALRALDYEGIERAAELKVALDARLRAVENEKTPADLPALKRVRRAALDNQLLIVHARSCLQGIIGMVTGDTFVTYPGATGKRAAPEPLRLNVRV
jgi:hypothetical protein